MGAKRALLLAVSVGASLSSWDCQRVAQELSRHAAPQVLKSWDGKFQVTVPAGWITNRNLNDKADLGVSKAAEEYYLVVLSESVADFVDMDLSRHSDTTLERITHGLASSTVGPVKHVEVAGQPALQYEIQGVSHNLRIHYLHTTVELGGYYHQILAWTLASRWERNQSTLRAAVASFSAVPGARAKRD